MEDFNKRILLSVTGERPDQMEAKFNEINNLGIAEAALFWECHDRKTRDSLYPLLLKSNLKRIPFIHIREDVTEDEIEFFKATYKTVYFNIHEDHFKLLKNWQKNFKNLYLEMNFDGDISKEVKVRRVGGFCVDLAHFKSAIARGAKEAHYVISKKDKMSFECNHLGGYDEELKKDVHYADSLRRFDYLTTLPKFVFGKVIALEIDNPIAEQIKFKDYIAGILNSYFDS